ncbi:hypothetical protein HL666_04945 [Bradyrhizobium sp. 83002]|uniref:hypothetical protein n=1 Tax=Bradyrhizobium aeschynomenes TaxID=2734909 RepID=UPI00155175E8|nr:hypothetical protein [Bradyrhizobium aeschynomenes]NPU10097.1 hypothetical protein [Bradyrhizobium aeschynomenes]
MPNLPMAVIRRLFSYERSRNGQQVPNTINGPLYQYACWNWVLSGGTLTADDFKSNSSIIANVLNTDAMGYPLGIKQDAAQQYPQEGNAVDLQRMAALLRDATMEGPELEQDCAPQTEFLECLVRIMLRVNGLEPIPFDADSRYNVIVRSKNWWNTDHWALRLYLGPAAKQQIQTVPDWPLMFSCSKVWDEDLAFVAVTIAGLHQNQVDQLATVPYSTCRGWVMRTKKEGGSFPFVCQAPIRSGSGQCGRCGFVACEAHLGSYDEAGVFHWGTQDDGHYKCQRCGEGIVHVLALE